MATAMSYTYNGDNRLTAYSTTGGVTFSLSNTTVDGLGRLIEADETLTKPDDNTVSHSHDYAYDMRSQLLSADITNIGGSTWSADYTYDKAGNVIAQTINTAETSFSYDGDLMTDKGNDSLTWDDNGRMISGVSSSLTYNWEGKLQSGSAGGDSIDLKYAPGFDRIFKESTVSQTTTKAKYIVDPTGDLSLILLEIDPDETDPNDAIRKTYIYANSQTIAQHDGNYDDSIYFYLHDRLGSTRQIIDTSANIKNKYTYQPFGESFSSEQAETITNDFMFTGQYYDSEIAQYYLRARQYDLIAYRFVSRDPYQGSFQEPLGLHRYLYCLNDSLNRIDPDGRFSYGEVQTTTGIKGWFTKALTSRIGKFVKKSALHVARSAFQGAMGGVAQGSISAVQGGSFGDGFEAGFFAAGIPAFLGASGIFGAAIAGGIDSGIRSAQADRDLEYIAVHVVSGAILGGAMDGLFAKAAGVDWVSDELLGGFNKVCSNWEGVYGSNVSDLILAMYMKLRGEGFYE